ncbi:hypothetical protein C8F01DRAFT_1263787 [Mycena amicta]|nr:hypothetical protein C8F01DRAFT_1263787 [Mycena amicta]
MASAEHGTTTTDSRQRRRRPLLRFPPLVFVFGVTVVLSFLILLAILYTLEYHLRLFLSTQSTPSQCAESLLGTLSSLSTRRAKSHLAHRTVGETCDAGLFFSLYGHSILVGRQNQHKDDERF